MLFHRYKNLKIAFFRFVTIHAFDRQTDGQTEFSSLDRVCIPCRAVKIITAQWTIHDILKYENQNEINIRYVSDQIVCWRHNQLLEIEKITLRLKILIFIKWIFAMSVSQTFCRKYVYTYVKIHHTSANLDSRFCWWRLAYDALSGDVRIVLCCFSSFLEH